jgi:hypothetical protein
VKDISLESFVNDLLIIGIDSEVRKKGVWVEVMETDLSYIMRFDTCDWDGDD